MGERLLGLRNDAVGGKQDVRSLHFGDVMESAEEIQARTVSLVAGHVKAGNSALGIVRDKFMDARNCDPS